MPRIRRPLRNPATSTLRPTAALTLLAALLAVAAALVGHRSGQEAAQLVEARGRLALVLAAQADARLGALRAALDEAAAGLEQAAAPDHQAALATLDAALRQRDPALAGLALEERPAPAPHGLEPGPQGGVHIVLRQDLPGARAHLTARADADLLTEGADRPRGLALLFAADDALLEVASGGLDETALATGATAQALRRLAGEARRASALAQRELTDPGGERLLAVAAPLRAQPLVLLLVLPAPAGEHGPPVGMAAVLLALAGTALAVLPLLRKKGRRP